MSSTRDLTLGHCWNIICVTPSICACIQVLSRKVKFIGIRHRLSYWGRKQKIAILQTTFCSEFLPRKYLDLGPNLAEVHFRWSKLEEVIIVSDDILSTAWSHKLNQWWPRPPTHKNITRDHAVKSVIFFVWVQFEAILENCNDNK